jgi:hypothetical protein
MKIYTIIKTHWNKSRYAILGDASTFMQNIEERFVDYSNHVPEMINTCNTDPFYFGKTIGSPIIA